jgi:hypothetical protein
MSVGPSQDEIEEWSERERRRRQAWLEGPSEYEKERWARGRRSRLRDEDADFRAAYDPHDPLVRRIRRDQRLALAGLAGLILDWPTRAATTLVREGREYEDIFDDPAYRRVPRFYRDRDDAYEPDYY